jgi:hypothetical protein
MHMNIFDDDAFTAVSMTEALEDYDFKPDLIGSLNLFEPVPVTTTKVSIEKRGNSLELIPTTPRGAPLPEGRSDGRNLRVFNTVRIAKGHTLLSDSVQDVRAFGKESELETVIQVVGREMTGLMREVELTWEFQKLGAVQGKVLDADGSLIIDWFSAWGIPEPEEINFELDVATTNVELKCRQVLRTMQSKANGSWQSRTGIVGLAGNSFFDKLTGHASVREVFLNSVQAQSLNQAFGAGEQSFAPGAYAYFDCGGIRFYNYRGADAFNAAAAEGSATGLASLGIPDQRCKFFPVNAPGVFRAAFAPGESFEFANTQGREVYAMLIRDTARDSWIRPEVYSYPLFICTRPEMLLTAKESATA